MGVQVAVGGSYTSTKIVSSVMVSPFHTVLRYIHPSPAGLQPINSDTRVCDAPCAPCISLWQLLCSEKPSLPLVVMKTLCPPGETAKAATVIVLPTATLLAALR